MSEATAKPRVLVIEDEPHLAAGLKLNFELDGYIVHVARRAQEATACLLDAPPYDVIILDVVLPDTTGTAFCRDLRALGDLTPVIMLTACNAPHDRVAGLDVGADDYLTKPFELNELLARVRSLLRRRQWERRSGSDAVNVIEFGDAYVDFDSHDVSVRGQPIKLTQLELELLRYFVDNAGRVMRREELLEKVWKLRNYPNTRTVDNFIVRLRRHFEPDPARPRFFESVRGAGYRFTLAATPSRDVAEPSPTLPA